MTQTPRVATGGTVDPQFDLVVPRGRAEQAFLARLEPGAVISFIGPPRLGKTSLVLAARATLRAAGRRVALVSLKGLRIPSTREFVARFTAALRREANLGNAPALPEDDALDAYLRAELRAFATGNGADGAGSPVLFLDDIEHIAGVEGARAILEVLDAVQRDLAFTLVFVGTRRPLHVVPGLVKLFPAMRPFDLPDFARTDLAPLEARFEEAYVQQVFQLTHGHPYLTMCLLRAHEANRVPPKLGLDEATALIFGLPTNDRLYEGDPKELLRVTSQDFEHRAAHEQVDALVLYRSLVEGTLDPVGGRVAELVSPESAAVRVLEEHGLVTSEATLREREGPFAWRLEGRNPIFDRVYGGKGASDAEKKRAFLYAEWGRALALRPHLPMVHAWCATGDLPSGEAGERIARWFEDDTRELAVVEIAFAADLSATLKRARALRWILRGGMAAAVVVSILLSLQARLEQTEEALQYALTQSRLSVAQSVLDARTDLDRVEGAAASVNGLASEADKAEKDAARASDGERCESPSAKRFIDANRCREAAASAKDAAKVAMGLTRATRVALAQAEKSVKVATEAAWKVTEASAKVKEVQDPAAAQRIASEAALEASKVSTAAVSAKSAAALADSHVKAAKAQTKVAESQSAVIDALVKLAEEVAKGQVTGERFRTAKKGLEDAEARAKDAQSTAKVAVGVAVSAMAAAVNTANQLKERQPGHLRCIDAMNADLDGGVPAEKRLDAVRKALECEEKLHQDGGSPEVKDLLNALLPALRHGAGGVERATGHPEAGTDASASASGAPPGPSPAPTPSSPQAHDP